MCPLFNEALVGSCRHSIPSAGAHQTKSPVRPGSQEALFSRRACRNGPVNPRLTAQVFDRSEPRSRAVVNAIGCASHDPIRSESDRDLIALTNEISGQTLLTFVPREKPVLAFTDRALV